MSNQPTPSIIRFNLGELELTIISDGYQTMQPAHPVFGPYIAPHIVQQLLFQNAQPVHHVDLALQILLIRKGDTLIMIDSGLGHFEQTGGRLKKGMLAADIQLGDITDIVLTHAHMDHIGGLFDEYGELMFTDARIYISKKEFEFWMCDEPDFNQSAMKDNHTQTTSLVNDIRNRLCVIEPSLCFIEPGIKLLDCLNLIAAPGHTPGHIIVEVFSGNQRLVHIADTVHSEVLLFPHPEWGFIFDVNFQQAVAIRTAILNKLAQNNTLTLAYHLPWPGLGYVNFNGTAFKWEPVAIKTFGI